MTIKELQEVIRRTYYDKDSKRGPDLTFIWLVEEMGELAEAVRKRDREAVKREMSDLIAWTLSLANLLDIDVEEAMERYANGCPKCGSIPCKCEERLKGW